MNEKKWELQNVWDLQTEEKIGEKIQEFLRFIRFTNDSAMDVERFLSSEYGQELGRRLLNRCRLEDDPKAEEAYCREIGVELEVHLPEDYYGRWKLFAPEGYEADAALPILIWNHGGDNSIESEEFMTGYLELVPKERFLLIMAQNTNPDQNLRILEEVRKRYPVDESRIYMGGFSQGSLQAFGTAMHHCDKIAAIAVTGMDPYRPWDAQDEPYTKAELERAKAACVPVSVQVGACEPFAYAPLNQWRPHIFNLSAGKGGSPDSFFHPGKESAQDPTRITKPGRGRYDPKFPDRPRMPSQYIPARGEDPGAFMLRKTNERLELLGCAPREMDTCIGYAALPEDELRRITGIYGDREETFYYGGIRHDLVGIKNSAGMEVFRYIVVENSPHWPPVTTARLGWEFLRQFRRNRTTGALEQICECNSKGT